MEKHTIKIEGLQEYEAAAQTFINLMGDKKIFAFYGKMGVGKTTFVKSLCKALGVDDTVNSPTFAIVNEYADAEGYPIYHFDFYRIKSVAELFNLGYEDYFYGGAMCFIEWPQLAEEILPEDTVKVTIEENEDGTREITIEG